MKCRAHITILCLFVSLFFNLSKGQNTQENALIIQKSNGLIFTDIEINDTWHRALIDFADPHILMLSYSKAKQKGIDLVKSRETAHFLNGKSYELFTGNAESLKVGNWEMRNVEFSSSPEEIENINKNVDLPFDAVLGWSFFSKFNITLDYSNNKLFLSHEKSKATDFDFSSSFTGIKGYLELAMEFDGEILNFILDTASPLNLIDNSIQSNHKIHTSINGNDVNLKFYSTDLSLLQELDVHGMLGTDFFKMYTVCIDTSNNVILFRKSSYSLSLLQNAK